MVDPTAVIKANMPTTTRLNKTASLQFSASKKQMSGKKSTLKPNKQMNTNLSKYNQCIMGQNELTAGLKLNYTISEVATPSEVAAEG